ncbi:bifunctional 2-polyprenyl-6-hydroxyphenol methylase/3-demethylubiquinol 3-O-methyltransferase UbiG [Glaciecola sp. MH2013]|uniref:bifunctional 2-polyprenyl-6-hydroxyphenol methylase/3-demethylubiquinol 3-O-methyltransferase UbiG n=1 Tax=Glaciecola sp. MH2013 TaxID=2785524 RepID=UPI00189E14B8|nr:bifunctional 2-polyprenyl-6-hydroxyphenol methylase/3-demethylubiquinol 3-O-methyltransferase UbiG [Glaciecola sp. MH2013]MBF7074098.1 bifunctional 2-polyprenyl-6-hydroxyphenol methylase/3-demethylubiquinol 3-O-methyltransferase UbiG [Glaciecola sp. MH2013]
MLDKSKLTNISNTSNCDTNVSSEEIARFDALAESWWDPNGKYKTALIFNQARISYFLPQICAHFGRNLDSEMPLQGLRVLDVGSGGGLVCEPLAKLGAMVTGIDASEMSVQVARRHAQASGLDIEYRHCLSSDLASSGSTFDLVINAEVVEHVPDQAGLIKECAVLTRDQGMTIFATLNRTPKSFIIAIVGAEYVMRYLPIGTHSWRKFVKPAELKQMAENAGLRHFSESGMAYNPFSKKWRLSENMSVNYIQCYTK